MADYIDREELLKELHMRHWDVIIDFIEENFPSVDAVDVVRCKDCKYASMTSGGECKYCKQWETEEALYLDGNFFCAWGETECD